VKCDNFDSLSLLPNLSIIKFPEKIVLDKDLLRQINLHPNLIVALWDSMDGLRLNGSFHYLSQELSRVCVQAAYGDEFGMPAIQYFAFHGLGIMSLTIEQGTSPQFSNMASTFSSLADLRVHIQPNLCPEPLNWLPSFLDRHPRLKRVHLNFGDCRQPVLTWEALKTIPPLYNAVQKRDLFSSFHFSTVNLAYNSDRHASDRFALTDTAIVIDVADRTLDILRCLSPFIKDLKRLVLHSSYRDVPQGQVPVLALVSYTITVSS
jgi:hypothetical protein